MSNTRENMHNQAKIAEYVIIGGGPAAIAAIPALLNTGVSGEKIVWIDPTFHVGDFGTTLSVGSSVPGNTSVENYQKVNKEIYKMIPACAPEKNQLFEIDSLPSSFVCSLKTASEPLQHITNRLRTLVHSLEGKAFNIVTGREGLTLDMRATNGATVSLQARRVILAIGAQAKTLQLPKTHKNITIIHPNITFIQSELAAYLQNNKNVTTVAVIGSSHSAALATMHLLKAGLVVKQFMDKEYRYATPSVTQAGIKYTMYDNTGLKGDVAKFTKQLLDDVQAGQGEYKNKFTRYVGKNRQETTTLLENNLFGCSHAIAAIGYEPSETLRINSMPLSHFHHNNKTTEIDDVPGLYGIGVAFPQQAKSISGEIESAVGVGKFWATANNSDVLAIWRKNRSSVASQIQNVHTLFHQEANPVSRPEVSISVGKRSKL